jgi:hypothetical protein
MSAGLRFLIPHKVANTVCESARAGSGENRWSNLPAFLRQKLHISAYLSSCAVVAAARLHKRNCRLLDYAVEILELESVARLICHLRVASGLEVPSSLTRREGHRPQPTRHVVR